MTNLYLLKQDVSKSYGAYSECVVAADSMGGARDIHPNVAFSFAKWDDVTWMPHHLRDQISAVKVGITDLPVGTVLISSRHGSGSAS